MNRQEAAQEQKLRNYFPWFGGLCLLYGALFAFCMYRNLFGCTFFIYTAATVILLSVFLKKLGIILKKAVLFCFGGVLLCGAATCITGSALLQWGNWCCALCLLLAAMLEQFRGLGGEPVFDGIRDGWHLFADTLRCTAMPVKELRRRFLVRREEREAREEAGELREDEWSRGKYIGAGLVAAAAAMCVLLPLLLSSDLVFRQLFVSLLETAAGGFQNMGDVLGAILTAVLGAFLLYGFFAASCRVTVERKSEEKQPAEEAREQRKIAAGIAFAGTIAAVYGIYVIIQAVCLFAGGGVLPEGVTYSEYAHSGFWQLTAVAVLNVLLVLACSQMFKQNRALRILLLAICACTFVMIASAAFRLALYVAVYRLTFLRLLAFWGLGILTVAMAGVAVSICRTSFPLFRYLTAVAACGYLAFVLSGPDYQVADYNVSCDGSMTQQELEYLLHGLSWDAAPVIAGIDIDRIAGTDDDVTRAEVRWAMYYYFQNIANSQERMDFRQISISDVSARDAALAYLSNHDPALG